MPKTIQIYSNNSLQLAAQRRLQAAALLHFKKLSPVPSRLVQFAAILQFQGLQDKTPFTNSSPRSGSSQTALLPLDRACVACAPTAVTHITSRAAVEGPGHSPLLGAMEELEYAEEGDSAAPLLMLTLDLGDGRSVRWALSRVGVDRYGWPILRMDLSRVAVPQERLLRVLIGRDCSR